MRDMKVTTHPDVHIRGMRTESWPGRWVVHLLSWEIHTYTLTRTLGPTTSPSTQGLHMERQRRDPNTQGGTGKSPTQKVGHHHLRGVGAAHVSCGSKAHEHAVGPASDQPIHSPSSLGHLLMAREDPLHLRCRNVPLPAMSGVG